MINFKPHKRSDIVYRVKWFNNDRVNKYIGDKIGQKTIILKETEWFDRYIKNKNKKFFTICDSGLPIGLVGLSKIDKHNKEAEVFIAIGNDDYCGKGFGKKSMEYIINYGF